MWNFIHRVASLTKERVQSPITPSIDSLPITDIDQLSRSMDDEGAQSPTETNSHRVQTWLDSESPGVNGHPVPTPRSHDRDSIVSDTTSEKRKVSLVLVAQALLEMFMEFKLILVSQKTNYQL